METVVTQRSGYAALVADAAPALLRLAVMLTGSREEREPVDAGPDGVTTRQVSDPEEAAQVVSLANGLPGVPTGECVHSCPTATRGTCTLRFLGPAGAFVVRATDDLCGIGATLKADGSLVEPDLDPDRSFFTRIDGLLRRR